MEKINVILLIVFLITVLSLWLVYKRMTQGFGPNNMKVYGITLIVFASLIVVLSDISPEKTAACFGIFGAIGGYLFGLKNTE